MSYIQKTSPDPGLTGDVWLQKYENKKEGFYNYLKYSFNRLLKISLRLRHRVQGWGQKPDPHPWYNLRLSVRTLGRLCKNHEFGIMHVSIVEIFVDQIGVSLLHLCIVLGYNLHLQYTLKYKGWYIYCEFRSSLPPSLPTYENSPPPLHTCMEL